MDKNKYLDNLENLKIEVRIAHHPNPLNLGKTYNYWMSKADNWVLFLDHDIFLLHPKWYEICVRAITRLGDKAGFITCGCNRIGRQEQKFVKSDSDDILWHTERAIQIEKLNRGRYTRVTPDRPLSGQMILTHRKAWEDSGGFVEHRGICGPDNDYHRAIETAGYEGWVMNDMYVYHRYKRYWKNPEYDYRTWGLK